MLLILGFKLLRLGSNQADNKWVLLGFKQYGILVGHIGEKEGREENGKTQKTSLLLTCVIWVIFILDRTPYL